ncbi:MAG: NifB/NifX family molybdenum-iron cluster-binding protein [Deltaproteobacteria bacterium]|nr:NifB/NifX family molybdenum-iron cluster-binding protein [Deltaproteobacteria bacterium]
MNEIVKIVIPAENDTGKTLSAHFGRAPYFAWYVIENGQIKEEGVAKNTSDHFGGVGAPPETIKSLGGEVVISSGMGMRAIQMFQALGIAVLKGVSMDSLENVKAFIAGGMEELTEGCLAHHEH